MDLIRSQNSIDQKTVYGPMGCNYLGKLIYVIERRKGQGDKALDGDGAGPWKQGYNFWNIFDS